MSAGGARGDETQAEVDERALTTFLRGMELRSPGGTELQSSLTQDAPPPQQPYAAPSLPCAAGNPSSFSGHASGASCTTVVAFSSAANSAQALASGNGCDTAGNGHAPSSQNGRSSLNGSVRGGAQGLFQAGSSGGLASPMSVNVATSSPKGTAPAKPDARRAGTPEARGGALPAHLPNNVAQLLSGAPAGRQHGASQVVLRSQHSSGGLSGGLGHGAGGRSSAATMLTGGAVGGGGSHVNAARSKMETPFSKVAVAHHTGLAASFLATKAPGPLRVPQR